MNLERQLIEKIRKNTENGPDVPGLGIGDDAAFLLTHSLEHDKIIISTDSLVEGVHFDLAYGGYPDAAVKLFEMSASDILAKGGTPRWALLNLSITRSLAFMESSLEPTGPSGQVKAGFINTLIGAAHAKGVAVIGGDITLSATNVFTMTMLGTASGPAGHFISRKNSSIQKGDLLVMSGAIGGSTCGFEELQAGRETPLAESYRRPAANWDNGWLHQYGALASLDQSDTFHESVSILAAQNNLVLRLDLDAVGLHPGLSALSDEERLRLTLNASEDFAVLAILPGGTSIDPQAGLCTVGRVEEVLKSAGDSSKPDSVLSEKYEIHYYDSGREVPLTQIERWSLSGFRHF